MEEERFRELVQEAWEQVPPVWAQKMDNVALLVEDEPGEDIRREEGLLAHDSLLGLYHGIPLTERGDAYGTGMTLPDTISLYRIPILEEAHDCMRAQPVNEHTQEGFDAVVRTVIQETLWHEIGHYFGLSEGEIGEREHKGTNLF